MSFFSGITSSLPSSVTSLVPSSVTSMLPSSVTSMIPGSSSSSSGLSVTDTMAGAQQAATDVQEGAKSAMSYVPYVLGGMVVLAIVILVPLYFLGYLTPKKANVNAPATIGQNIAPFKSGPSVEAFQTTIDSADETLINVQPLSIKDVGFQGPYPNGVFDPDAATAGALKAGFRFLMLQIDFMDSDKDSTRFAAPMVPTLLLRSPSGALLSTNSGSIAAVAKAIANAGFNPSTPNSTRPIVLYLHINRTPVSAVSDPNGYLAFLSKIAKDLAPLAPYHVGLTPMGNFTRQKMEGALLTTPLKSLEGQVIIMSNADTTLFRSKSSSIQQYNPSEDLDFWVNMRVFLDSEEDVYGITQLADPISPPSAVIVNMDRILSFSESKRSAFAAKSKQRYVIAMGSRTSNPTPETISLLINTLGVNSVPVDIFTETTDSILAITDQYAKKAFRPKPLSLQNIVQ